MVSVWPLTTTSCTGAEGVDDGGCAVDDAPRAGVGDATGWADGCGWATGGLRLVVGRRLVCAIDADEKIRSSIAENRVVGRRVFENFIRCLSSVWLRY